MNITETEKSRYARHLSIPDFGEDSQKKLKGASVLVVGAGGLGSPIIMYLAAAGIGELGIIDADAVSLSNLQRQVLYKEADIDQPKASTAATFCEALNPHVSVRVFDFNLDKSNALQIIQKYQIVVDATDNFETRYLMNRICQKLKIPMIHGSIYHFDGQVSVFNLENGPCYECLYPQTKTEGAEKDNGVFGVLPGVIGTIQATEVIKLITGKGSVLAGKILLYDALSMSFTTLKVKKNEHCSVCGIR